MLITVFKRTFQLIHVAQISVSVSVKYWVFSPVPSQLWSIVVLMLFLWCLSMNWILQKLTFAFQEHKIHLNNVKSRGKFTSSVIHYKWWCSCGSCPRHTWVCSSLKDGNADKVHLSNKPLKAISALTSHTEEPIHDLVIQNNCKNSEINQLHFNFTVCSSLCFSDIIGTIL